MQEFFKGLTEAFRSHYIIGVTLMLALSTAYQTWALERSKKELSTLLVLCETQKKEIAVSCETAKIKILEEQVSYLKSQFEDFKKKKK